MSTFNVSQIIATVQAQFIATAEQNPPQRVAASQVADNCKLRVDIYSCENGKGFAVVASIPFGTGATRRNVLCCMQSGPQTEREQYKTIAELLPALLLAQFQSLSPGVQAFFDPVRAAVNSRLLAGDVAGAKDIVATLPPMPTPEMQASQAALLSIFP